ncbi:hypothetical protein [Flavobacterium sp.]|uniref:hypothetical protein n=1 Tax=Flavobacterium sp. TaxID=239 RepID=UPI0028BE3195|nr:hypothetical protein [Flavobacterium sp.]
MKNNELSTIYINAFLIAQFLFFIDEGYYDFRWMKDIGNWIVFFIYFGILTAVLFLLNSLLLKMRMNKKIVSFIDLLIVPTLLVTIFYFSHN